MWLLSSKVTTDERDVLTLIGEMQRTSSLFDREHEETQRLCRDVTAQARRGKRAALKRGLVRLRSPKKR